MLQNAIFKPRFSLKFCRKTICKYAKFSTKTPRFYPRFKIHFPPQKHRRKIQLHALLTPHLTIWKRPLLRQITHISPSQKPPKSTHFSPLHIYPKIGGGVKSRKKFGKCLEKVWKIKENFITFVSTFKFTHIRASASKQLEKQTESLRLDRLNIANSLK